MPIPAPPPARRPAGLEVKAAAAVLDRAALGGYVGDRSTSLFDLTGDPPGTAWLLAAVTGIEDDQHDVLVPGSMTRSLRERQLKGVMSHNWSRPVAVQRKALELLPGDPRLPRTLPGNPPRRWPAAAGALAVKAKFILSTRDGRDAYEQAKAYGPDQAAFSIGYRVTPNGASHRGGVRYISDLDVFEWSNVLHGANRHAVLMAVKSGRPRGLETKATTSALLTPAACATCGNLRAAGLTNPSALAPGTALVCSDCLDAVDQLTADSVHLDPADVAAAAALTAEPEVTSEDAYQAAVDGEQGWQINPDGTLVAEDAADPTQGPAWSRGQRQAGRRRP